ncbi:MAG: hypothetical protein E5V40_04355 [Mesorhizobium sp.]|nr:hypothetical protein EN779_13775 [Mesorhizobium sp. M4B.F.Ca.ET.088.02.2.1]TIX43158.1 MAG: hypothetical protein E5V40_04355 [Mesorhizobium sp.]
MTLLQFDVTGEQVSDDETEEVIRKAEPHRDLIRYRPGGSALFVREGEHGASAGCCFAACPAPEAHPAGKRIDAA